MSLSKIKLFRDILSFTNAQWNIISIDSFTQRYTDYLNQKYNVPNVIAPYLLYKGINLDKFDDF